MKLLNKVENKRKTTLNLKYVSFNLKTYYLLLLLLQKIRKYYENNKLDPVIKQQMNIHTHMHAVKHKYKLFSRYQKKANTH